MPGPTGDATGGGPTGPSLKGSPISSSVQGSRAGNRVDKRTNVWYSYLVSHPLQRAAPGPVPVPLIVRSAHSMGRGTANPDTLVRSAREQGLDALALTDRDNLYGAIAFLRAAGDAGVHAILGAEVTRRDGPPQIPGEEGARGIARGPAQAAGSVVLLVRESSGYRSLCRILSARHLAASFDLVDAIGRCSEGLEALVQEPVTLELLRAVLPRERLHAAIVRPGRGRDGEAALRGAARRLDIDAIGTLDVFLGATGDASTHRLLAAVRENELVTRLDPGRLAPEGAHLAGPAETFRLFADDPSLLAASRRLAMGCSFSAADLPAPGSLFPKLPLPEGESAYDRLYRMTQDGLRRRYARVTRETSRRLSWELEQIDAMGFTDYFVVVGDIVRGRARARNPDGRPRQRRELDRLVSARDHQRRSRPLPPDVRAVPAPAAARSARSGHRPLLAAA